MTKKKHEKELNSMIIMDDYDGGKANCMRTVIEDLKSSVCNEADKELDY